GVKHRVIVRTRRDRLNAVEDRVETHGNHVESQHTRLNAFTATVHGSDLRALEADADIESVSIDAVITSHDDGSGDSQSGLEDRNLLLYALELSYRSYHSGQR